jgi:hypothetical protein
LNSRGTASLAGGTRARSHGTNVVVTAGNEAKRVSRECETGGEQGSNRLRTDDAKEQKVGRQQHVDVLLLARGAR